MVAPWRVRLPTSTCPRQRPEYFTAHALNPEHHPTPVLILLTCGDLTDVVQARQLGANSYLQKAIDFQHFTSRLQQELEHWLAQAG